MVRHASFVGGGGGGGVVGVTALPVTGGNGNSSGGIGGNSSGNGGQLNSGANEDNTECISSLEHRVHEVFASARVSGEDFVYSPINELYARLDEYCEDSLLPESKSPILITGGIGVGKSALLANFIHRRSQLQSNRQRMTSNTEEFIFWHAVGCSRQSQSVTYLLRRLIESLHNRFELSRQIPSSPDRLSWELPRFLDLASKKGKILIIIDGIHRLQSIEGIEDSLSWLPLELPCNVRFILSATTIFYDENDEKDTEMMENHHIIQENEKDSSHMMMKRNHIISELKRRKVPQIMVTNLDKAACHTLIMAYIQNSTSSASSEVALGPYLAVPGQNINSTTSSITGFLLYPIHIANLLDHPMGGNPLFIRLFLRCLHFVCLHGCSLWNVYDEWIKATDLPSLLVLILNTCEKAYKKNRQNAQIATDLTGSMGGAEALAQLYNWHPVLRELCADSLDVATAFGDGKPSAKELADGLRSDHKTSSNSTNMDQDNSILLGDALTNIVMQNLENQSTREVEHQAQRKLQRAVTLTKQNLDTTFSELHTTHAKRTFIADVAAKICGGLAKDFGGDFHDLVDRLNRRERADSADTFVSYQSQLLNEQSSDSDGSKSDDDSDNNTHNSNIHGDPSNGPSPAASFLNQVGTCKEDTFLALPQYLRGGSHFAGFGDLLGNALALLYIARQGLREQELWKILSFMEAKTRQSKSYTIDKRENASSKKATLKNMANLIQTNRSGLTAFLRAEDITKSGYVTQEQLYTALKKITKVKKADLAFLLDFIELKIIGDGSSVTPNKANGKQSPVVMIDDLVHYEELFVVLARLQKRISNESKQLWASFSNTMGDTTNVGEIDDNFDDFRLDDGRREDELSAAPGGEETIPVQTSLGPVVEELMLKLLCALGVLYSPENKVLILPNESETLRSTIYERYILPRGNNTVQYWHNLIIQYFRTQPNSLRKCEELPWHLKICRKWTALKDCLVDLRTFDLMSNNNLRDELMQYWRLLTEGPLFTFDPTSTTLSCSPHGPGGIAGATGGKRERGEMEDISDNVSTSSHILRELDEALQQRISLKEVRRRATKLQVQPFDIVDELNRSVETWVTTELPPPAQMYRVIWQIAKFLLDFARSSVTPQFRRVGIDMYLIEQFDMTHIITDLQQAMINPTRTNNNVLEEEEDGTAENGLVRGTGGGAVNRFDATQRKEEEKFPSPVFTNSSFYHYIRWVWIQFPWLVLHRSSSELPTIARRKKREDREEDLNRTLTDSTDKPEGEIQPNKVNSFERLWRVKKADPDNEAVKTTINRKLAAIKPRSSISATLERNVSATCTKLLRELEQPSHIAQVRLGIGETQRMGKFRRTFDEEVQTSQSIPFAYHSSKVTRNRSLFPTYSAALRDSKKKKLDQDLLLMEGGEALHSGPSMVSSSQNASGVLSRNKSVEKFNIDAALKGDGGNCQSTFMLTEVDDEIRRITGDEYIDSHRVDNAHGGLVKDEVDLEHVALNDRITRMKSVWNKLLIIEREKQRIILNLENDIYLRDEGDAQLRTEVENAEALIRALHDRNTTMEENCEEAKLLEKNYELLARELKKNPPYVESHVRSLELEAELAEKQLNDLCAHRAKLYYEAERKNAMVKRQILERISYFKNARQEVEMKQKEVLEDRIMSGVNITQLMSRIRSPSPHRTTRNEASLSRLEGDNESGDGSSNDVVFKEMVQKFKGLFVKEIVRNKIMDLNVDSRDDITAVLNGIVPDQKRDGMNSANGKRAASTKTTNFDQTDRSQSENDNQRWKYSEAYSRNGGGDNSYHGNAERGERYVKKTLSAEQVLRIIKATKSLQSSDAPLSSDPNVNREHLSQQARQAVESLFTRTESSSIEELIERFHHARSLHETLRSQQVLADSRLSQLRAEHADLHLQWTESSFGADVSVMRDTTVSANGTDEEKGEAERYLDNKLFAKEVRMHQYQRLHEKAIHHISEVRTSITHLVNLLQINSEMLPFSHRHPPSSLQSDSELLEGLMWCEDRLMSLNEALSMDATRTAPPNEESKSLSQRQMELANVVQEMLPDSFPLARGPGETGGNYSANGTHRKEDGGISKNLIFSKFSNLPVTERRISTPWEQDQDYETKVTRLMSERDKHEDILNNQNHYLDGRKNSNEVQRFLAEGLDQKTTKNVSRQARMLINKGTGKSGNFGIVMEELLLSRGQSLLTLTKDLKNVPESGASAITKEKPAPSINDDDDPNDRRCAIYKEYKQSRVGDRTAH